MRCSQLVSTEGDSLLHFPVAGRSVSGLAEPLPPLRWDRARVIAGMIAPADMLSAHQGALDVHSLASAIEQVVCYVRCCDSKHDCVSRYTDKDFCKFSLQNYGKCVGSLVSMLAMKHLKALANEGAS